MLQHPLAKTRSSGGDGFGTYILDDSNIDNTAALSHQHLAIFALSVVGRQSRKNHRGQTIVFNSEVFNWRGLRMDLEAVGYHINTPVDTTIVMAAWDRWSAGYAKKFNGLWAFALFCSAIEPGGWRLFLCLNQIGIKPLYMLSIGPATRLRLRSDLKAAPALSDGAIAAAVTVAARPPVRKFTSRFLNASGLSETEWARIAPRQASMEHVLVRVKSDDLDKDKSSPASRISYSYINLSKLVNRGVVKETKIESSIKEFLTEQSGYELGYERYFISYLSSVGIRELNHCSAMALLITHKPILGSEVEPPI